MLNLFLVASGGAAGAILRYALSSFLKLFIHNSFYATLSINVLGSFFIGYLISMSLTKIQSEYFIKYFLIIGFLGSFTTFSTFSLNIYQLYLDKQFLYLAIYSTCSILGGLLFLLIGIFISNLIINN